MFGTKMLLIAYSGFQVYKNFRRQGLQTRTGTKNISLGGYVSAKTLELNQKSEHCVLSPRMAVRYGTVRINFEKKVRYVMFVEVLVRVRW